MEPTSREDLSALMDGELAAEPSRFLLRRLDHDPDLAATWSRWHMVRACLAADPARLQTPRQQSDFAARIANALQAEAAPVRPRRWARYVGGGAIAASVAVAALMLNVPNPATERTAALAQQASPAASAAVPVALAESAPTRVAPSWLLARQPTVLGAQPASANVIYGTGLMQPDYLRRATFARDVALSYAPSLQGDASSAPATVVLMPAAPRSSGASAAH